MAYSEQSKNGTTYYPVGKTVGTTTGTSAGQHIPGAPSYVRATGNGTGYDARQTSTPKTDTKYVYVDSGASYDDGSSARLQALRDAIERNRQNAINSLNKSKEADLVDWRNNWNQLRNNYQGLIDQSEIERFKTLRSQRENQANRGQLNSGYGRQTMLNTDTRYGNQLIGIKNQEQSDLSALKSTLANIMASYKQKETEINNNTDNSLLQLM